MKIRTVAASSPTSVRLLIRCDPRAARSRGSCRQEEPRLLKAPRNSLDPTSRRCSTTPPEQVLCESAYGRDSSYTRTIWCDASTLGYRVIMVADANASVDDESHNATLHMIYRTFGDVRPTTEVLGLINESTST